ncbi:hypothetical protein SAMN05444671_4514 [Flavobacterium sp. CF108]|uniref:hypothetical protein n=1 Tax=unclassified Flavobacterium TaxID=196869 RepID=UPI0008C6497B|nr:MULTISPECIES: hypothetical protein [unclassified Flavobacterium]SEP04867.1 hypothetical protein SAMN04487978_4304 [Flavobacterium sp. fv08]SHH97147.1 hypothetical protein SAMN05444671_4514 [Flavobacterium sp. CF108]
MSINLSFGQNHPKYKIYNQSDFEKNKVFNQVYSLRIDKSNLESQAEDSIFYFIDARNYKGIINYGVTFRSKNHRNFHFLEYLSMCFLKIEINKCYYSQKDSIINIEGFVSGNWDWGSNQLIQGKKMKSNIDILLGKKTDTIRSYYLGKTVNKDSVEVKFHNKEANEFTVLDTFPAFYFKKYSHYRTSSQYGRLPFKISGKVTKNTLLAFGSWSTYSEIFDLGSMIYYPEKNQQKKVIKKEELDCIPIITANKLVSDIEKEKTQKEEINYYTHTQNAENYILARQYAKAKEEYNLLSQNYPILFARDISNAARCAILSRDFKTAFLWSEKLALKGIELSYFNSKIFNGMRKNPEWKIFSIKYDSICKLTKSNWNLKLKKDLDNLLNEDQADYGLENRKSPKTLYETTERVTGKLIDLLKKEGFPSEEKIGSLVGKDTVLISFPDFYVLILHAMQQTPKNMTALNELLDKSSNALEYDKKRNFNNILGAGSCFRIYKGNLYNSKSCGRNDLEVRKISFKFNNPHGFIMDYGNFVIEAYDAKNPKTADDYYKENYNLIMKLTDDWEFYDK